MVHGTRGVLFKVRLTSHGYTVAAKCTDINLIGRLNWEAAIYERLRSIQGIYVPVHLGNIDLDRPYFYDGIAEIVHMISLSFGGQLISRHISADNRLYLTEQVKRLIQPVHRLGVLLTSASSDVIFLASVGITVGPSPSCKITSERLWRVLFKL